jgi:hypothetical protein
MLISIQLLFCITILCKMSRIQNYFSSEFLASGLSAEFNDFITKITQAKSKAVMGYVLILILLLYLNFMLGRS